MNESPGTDNIPFAASGYHTFFGIWSPGRSCPLSGRSSVEPRLLEACLVAMRRSIGPAELDAGAIMGHDTTAYLGRIVPSNPRIVASSEERGEEIAELRGNWGQYEALGAEEYDGKVSGIGIGRWFHRGELRAALRVLYLKQRSYRNTRWSCRPAIKLIGTCLDRLPANEEWVYIEFG